MSDTWPQVKQALKKLDTTKVPTYEAYFETLRPKTPEDKFRRGLFALASVHTSWESNINLYSKLWDLAWKHDPVLLRERIIESRAGLVNGRVKAIMAYTSLYETYPGLFERNGDDWYKFRDRIQDHVLGLGPAKSAFFIELTYFHDSRICCADTHFLQMYGIEPKDVGNVKNEDRARMEMHFDLTCQRAKINPVTARWLLWDQKAGQPDSRFWSYVLEGEPRIPGEQKQLTLGELAA